MAWIDELFKRMVEAGASDLHLSSCTQPMFRIDGDMVTVADCPELSTSQLKQILREITPDFNQKEFESRWDTDFAYEIEELGRFRCNLFMDRKGPGGVFRLIPSDILTASDLNLPKAVLDLCYLTKGLVVVTGPTGSGKSTTLAAMMDHINKTRTDHIITIEDPIEFVHPNKKCLVNQREVRRHTSDFKSALRAALREDPDIVLVGEMRDLETVEIALETAETGHLVFGTLHTNTAPSTVDRIIDQFPANRQSQIRTMLASSLKGVIAQTLCKRQPKGRVAALEIMIVNSAIAANVREGKTHQIPSAMQMGGKLGMCSLNDSLLRHVMDGIVTPEEAFMKGVNKGDLQAKFNRANIRVDLSKIGDDSARAAEADDGMDLDQPAAPFPTEHAMEPEPTAPPSGGNFSDPFEQFKKTRG